MKAMTSTEFDQNLDRLAEVAVHSGLGLAPGQELVITATLDAVALARCITKHAYKAGASLVTTLFTDEDSSLLRFHHGSDATFDAAPSWLYEGMAQAYRELDPGLVEVEYATSLTDGDPECTHIFRYGAPGPDEQR